LSEVEPEIQFDGPPVTPPVLETVIHNAALEVRKVPIEGAPDMTLLRFHTPAIVFTIKLDDGGVNALISGLRGGNPDIVVAGAQDIAGLRQPGA
jgi:hypothetical protein